MADFYRWKQPTWATALTVPNGGGYVTQPNGARYHFLNVRSEGAGGTSALYDGIKSGGPNDGTFFPSFGEDARSAAIGRALKVLGENTDLLDDWMNADKVVPFLYAVSIGGAPRNNLDVPAETYLGPPGGALNSTNLPKYIRLLKTNGDEVVDLASNEVIQAQSITAGVTSPTPPYTTGDETVTFNHNIPVGSYLLLFYTRSSLARMVRASEHPYDIIGLARTSGVVQTVFQGLRGDGQSWLLGWPSTIESLVRRGLDGVYRNATARPTLPTALRDYTYGDNDADKQGVGGAYVRNGPSLMAYSALDISGDSPYCDLLGALFTAWVHDTNGGDGITAHDFMAGSRGFVFLGQRIRGVHGTHTTGYAPSLGGFTSFVVHRDERTSATNVPTVLDVPVGVTVQYTAAEDRVNITTGGNYFRKTISGTTTSSLVVGLSLLEIEWVDPTDPYASGTVRRLYRVMEIQTDTRVRVRAVDGSKAGFPAGLTVGTIQRVLTPQFLVPDGIGELQTKRGNGDASKLEQGSLVCLSLPFTTFEGSDQVHPGQGAYFGAAKNQAGYKALQWGGYAVDLLGAFGGQYAYTGALYGDGSVLCTSLEATGDCILGNTECGTLTATDVTCDTILCQGYCIVGLLSSNAQRWTTTSSTLSTPGSQTLTLAPLFANAMVVRLNITASPITFSSISVPLVSLSTGGKFIIIFKHNGGAAQIEEGAWSSDIKFENPEDALLSGMTGWTDMFEGIVQADGTALMSVRRYLS